MSKKHASGKQAVEGDTFSPTDIRFVGPATAAVIESAAFDAKAIESKQVSYETLVEAGVNHGVAARIRREHSLPWSFEGGGESLERRSSQVRGLQDGERAWVAASAGDWENTDPKTPASADGGGSAEAAEAAWRERSKPDPVLEIPDIDEGEAKLLAEGGITSIRSLATANVEHVADVLELELERIESWRNAARERL